MTIHRLVFVPFKALSALCRSTLNGVTHLVLLLHQLMYVALGCTIGIAVGGLVTITYPDSTPEWVFIATIVTSGFLGLAFGSFAAFGNVSPLTSNNSNTHGSARYATDREVAALTEGEGLIIGRENKKRGRLLRYNGPAHLLTLAPTRSGKGVGAILPNLLTADRSIICIDPKGENTRITHSARSAFGAVHVLDPFGISGHPSAAYNPISFLDAHSLDLVEDATTLADALVYDPPGQSREAHWNDEAKALIAGVIMFAVCHDKPEERTLNTVREYLTLGPERFTELLELMTQSSGANGLIKRAANRHLGKSDREAAAVLSTAQRHTHILDSARIVQVTERTDFRFADLKNRHETVFLVLPPERMSTYSRWLRLLLAQAIDEITRAKAEPNVPILFLLDEFAALGQLEAIERAMGLMASYGLQLWPILQDIHQLRDTYRQRAGTFLSNAAVVQTFNTNDFDTAKWISDVLGEETISFETDGISVGSGGASHSVSTQFAPRRLLNPDEVMTLDPSLMIMMRQGQRPIVAQKLRHYADKEFQGLF